MLRNSLIVQMVLCVLFLEKGKRNVVYHLPEKRVVPVEKQMKRSIFFGTGNCGQLEHKFPGIPVKSEKKGILRKVLSFFRKHSTKNFIEVECAPCFDRSLPAFLTSMML